MVNLLFLYLTTHLEEMKEENHKPIWFKALMGFLLCMIGLLFTFLVFRFIPIPNQTGFDGLSGLLLVLFCLGGIELLYIAGLLFSRHHPFRIFSLCLTLFVIALLLIRWLVIG